MCLKLPYIRLQESINLLHDVAPGQSLFNFFSPLQCNSVQPEHAEQGEDRWDSGPEEGGLAKSHAARLLSELAGYAKLHPLMVHTGAAAAIAGRGQELVCAPLHVAFPHSYTL